MTRACVTVSLIALMFTGCDRADVILDPGAPVNAADVQPGALKVSMTDTGVSSLYRVLAAEGIDVSREREALVLGGRSSQVGPFSQKVELGALSLVSESSALRVSMRFETPRFLVPLRVGVGNETVICRWQVTAQRVDVEGSLVRDGASFKVQGSLDVMLRQVQVDSLGDRCPAVDSPSDSSDSMVRQELEKALGDYVQKSLRASLDEFLSIDVAQGLGVPTGSLLATNESVFSNREGRLEVLAKSASQDGVVIEERRVLLNLDYGVRDTPAACAPREDVTPLSGEMIVSTAPTSRALEEQGADFGVAISTRFLERLVQTGVRAGFMCQGLESGKGETLSRRELLLGELGLSEDALGEQVSLVLGVGRLPTLSVDLRNNRFRVRFPSLMLEVYSEVLGVQMRVVKVSSEVEFQFRATTARRGFLTMEVASVKTLGTQVESDWQQSSPSQEQQEVWARRAMLLAVGESIDVPLFLFGARNYKFQSLQLTEGVVTLFLQI